MLNEIGRRLVFKFQTMETLYEAIVTGNLPEVHFLLGAGLGVNTPFNDGLYPLTVAVMHGREDVVQCLVEAGALINRASVFSTDQLQRQAMHHAAGMGLLGTVRLLLSRGVPVDVPDYGGSSPLHHAAARGHHNVVEFLLEKGADVNHTSDSGRTALWKAAQGGFGEMVRYLHEQGASVNSQNKVGASLLCEMARQRRVDLLADLLEMGAGIYARDIVGNNALHSAASSGCVSAAELLISAGASVNRVNDNGSSPLHDACNLNQVRVAACFLNHGAKFNTRNASCQTPLYMALLHLHSDVIDLLFSVGAEITELDVNLYKQYEISRWEYKEAFLLRVLSAHYTVRPLTHLCRIAIREATRGVPYAIEQAPLPASVKRFILLGEFTTAT